MEQTKREKRLERLSHWLLLGVLAITFFVALTAPAEGAVPPAERINAIATKVAGKPVSVVCSFDAEAWDEKVRQVSLGQRRGTSVDGYAYAGTTQAHLGPQACIPLYNVLTYGISYAGVGPSAFGLLTLLHEAMHLRGLRDEAATDCAALGVFKSYVGALGVSATVSKPTNVKGRYVLKRVVNPIIRALQQAAVRHHNNRPAEYQGGC